jgi:hypothetical protein
LHCLLQQLLRKATSHGGTLNIADDFEWVCTTGIADIINHHIDTDTMTLPFRVTSRSSHLKTREKTEAHNNVISEISSRTRRSVWRTTHSQGQRHELPAEASMKTIETAMKIKKPTDNGPDHIKANDIPENEEYDMSPVPQKISLRKEKTNHSYNYTDPRNRETDGKEEYISGSVHATSPRSNDHDWQCN